MFKIIYIPSGTEVSRHSTLEDANLHLSIVETTTPSHEIVEVPDIVETPTPTPTEPELPVEPI